MAKDTRLQKMLAECGIASRRKAEEMIAAGRVAVNGVRAQIGDKVDVKKDKVTVDGQRVQTVDEKVYIMVHKPRGYLTSMSDDRGRKCVSELVEELPVRLFPIGRLDKDSEGLLLMTNDGDFANLIARNGRTADEPCSRCENRRQNDRPGFRACFGAAARPRGAGIRAA